MRYLWVNLTYPPESAKIAQKEITYGFEILHGVLSYQKNINRIINKQFNFFIHQDYNLKALNKQTIK